MSEPRVALVTGAAQGIGRAVALELGRRGYDLALLDVQADALLRVAEEVRGGGRSALPLPGDLADLAYAQRSVDETADRFGRLDLLVNNAAWRELVTMRSIELDSWDRTLRICLTAPAFLSRWAAEKMRPQKRGVIVNVSSIMSQCAAGTAPAYVAAKGGLDALTRELAVLYGPMGIRVFAVNPGAVDTELSRDYRTAQADSLTDDLRAASVGRTPLGRWAQPEEIACTIAALASDEGSYLTGTCLALDGGWSISTTPYALSRRMFPSEFPATENSSRLDRGDPS